MITVRLRTMSWSEHSQLTGVVNIIFKGLTFSLPAMAVQSKGQLFKNVSMNLRKQNKDQELS